MMRSICVSLVVCLLACILGVSVARAGPAPELVKLVMPLAAGPDVVGEFVSDTPDAITIIELKSGKQRTFEKKTITKIKRDISDEDAIDGSDLASVMAWKINKLSATPPTVGRIAKISESTIYLTIGSTQGLAQGQKLNVFRVGADITDPVTHKVIAKERPRVAQLKVTEVQEAYAKAKLDGDLDVTLSVGDEVENIPLKVSVAALPLVDADGKETDQGVAVSEDMATALVRKKVQVVERALIMSVIKELAIQSSDLVDPATVQRLGKQLGASTVLTGKIVPEGEGSKVNVRLISVETGQVLLAASQMIKAGAEGAAGETGRPAAGGGRLASIRFTESMGYTIMPELKPGLSTHNNANNTIVDVPQPLKGHPFTQIVSDHPGAVHIHFLSAGKIYICFGDASPNDLEALKSIAKRESIPDLTANTSRGKRGNQVWSITAQAGKEYDIPFQVILVAGKLEKGK